MGSAIKYFRYKFPLRSDKLLFLLIAGVVVWVMFTLTTRPVYAVEIEVVNVPGFDLFNPGPWLAGLIQQAIAGLAAGLMTLAFSFIDNIKDIANLTSGFYTLVDKNGIVYEFVKSVNNLVVKNVASAILALVAMVQFLKMSQKADADETTFLFKDVFFFMLFLGLFIGLINYNMEILGAIYEVSTLLVHFVAGEAAVGSIKNLADLAAQSIQIESVTDIGAALNSGTGLLIVGVFLFLGLAAMALVSWVVVNLRGLEIMVMSAFAPIPLCLLMFDETKSFGINFIKNFAATCLAGAFIALLLALFPIVVGSMTFSSLGAGMALAIPMLALIVAFIILLVKCGSFARNLLGG